MIEALSDAEREARLVELADWSYDVSRAALYRRLKFADFAAALGAIVRIGVVAEGMNHHPEWSNIYDSLEVWLTTHDASGVTSRDVGLAREIDRIARESSSGDQHPPAA